MLFLKARMKVQSSWVASSFSNPQPEAAGSSRGPAGYRHTSENSENTAGWHVWVARKVLVGLLLAAIIQFGDRLQAQTVEKVADLTFGLDAGGAGRGGYAPLDRFTQVSKDLWFTTSRGGTYDLGTISRFDLLTHQVVQVASLDNNTGTKPESPLLVVGDEAYFTTVGGGLSNKGTISKIDLASGAVSPVFFFPSNGVPTGATPRAGLTRVGDDLWTLTQSGGTSNRGVVLKYNLNSGIASLITNLDGPLLGGQALDGFTQVGDALYYLTQSGGTTFKTTNYPVSVLPDGSTLVITNSLALGAGVLGRLTFDGTGAPIVTKVFDLPGGSTQFPATAPILVGTNSLYFTSTGPNSLPGAILRYELDTGLLVNLFSFSTNPIPARLYGTRPGYSGLTEWLGELYFINRNGGTNSTAPNSGGGTVAKFNVASNTVTKLVDLGNSNLEASLGSPGGFFGAGTIVQETNRFFIYYPLTSGGVKDLGTIIRISLPPQPILLSVAVTEPDTVTLAWTGGYPPFDVLTNGSIATDSLNWSVAHGGVTATENTTNWVLRLPAPKANTFYRIRGQSQ